MHCTVFLVDVFETKLFVKLDFEGEASNGFCHVQVSRLNRFTSDVREFFHMLFAQDHRKMAGKCALGLPAF